MNENAAILTALESLLADGKSAALATVVRVSGSSYRRPGARMLIAADGRTWGGVSGGCLERDVSRHARNVIENEAAEVLTYDTSDDFGTGTALGCAGIIDILIDPVKTLNSKLFHAIHRAVQDREAVILGTVIRSIDDAIPLAARYLAGDEAPHAIQIALQEASLTGCGGVTNCDGAELFVEILRPPQSLVLFGGGPDVVPVVEIAKTLGWRVTVIASHAVVGFRERFAQADEVCVGTDEDPLGGARIDAGAAVVLMTHNYARDLLLLPILEKLALSYFGILGPRRRAERLVLETVDISSKVLDRIHAPVGLDLGAETPQAIALAIVAEIQAVLRGRPCISLKDRAGPIYPEDVEAAIGDYRPVSCPISA